MLTEEETWKRMSSGSDAVWKVAATFCLLTGSLLAFIFIVNKVARIPDSRAFLLSDFVGFLAAVFLLKGILHGPRWRKPLGIIWLCLAALAAFLSSQYELLANLPELRKFHNLPEIVFNVRRACLLVFLAAVAIGVSLIVWQHRLDRSLADEDEFEHADVR